MKGKKQQAAKPKPAAQKPKPAPKATATAAKPSTSFKLTEGHIKTSSEGIFAFDRTNYIIMGIGLAIIVLGFIIMASVSAQEPGAEKMDEKIFGPMATTIPSLLIIAGLGVQVYAILKRPKKTESAE